MTTAATTRMMMTIKTPEHSTKESLTASEELGIWPIGRFCVEVSEIGLTEDLVSSESFVRLCAEVSEIAEGLVSNIESFGRPLAEVSAIITETNDFSFVVNGICIEIPVISISE